MEFKLDLPLVIIVAKEVFYLQLKTYLSQMSNSVIKVSVFFSLTFYKDNHVKQLCNLMWLVKD